MRRTFRTGKYDECAKAVEAGIQNDGWSEPWRQLKIKAELAEETTRRRSPRSRTHCFAFRQASRFTCLEVRLSVRVDTPRKRRSSLTPSEIYFKTRPGNTPRLRAGLRSGGSSCCGEDARKVLDQCYDVVTKQRRLYRGLLRDRRYGTWQGRLRPRGGDATESTESGCIRPPVSLSDGSRTCERRSPRDCQELAEALKINPRHVDTLLLVADEMIDSSWPTRPKDLSRHHCDVHCLASFILLSLFDEVNLAEITSELFPASGSWCAATRPSPLNAPANAQNCWPRPSRAREGQGQRRGAPRPLARRGRRSDRRARRQDRQQVQGRQALHPSDRRRHVRLPAQHRADHPGGRA